MPALVIESFPEALHARLMQTAAAHHRSVTQQTIHLLETALAAEEKPASEKKRRSFVLGKTKAFARIRGRSQSRCVFRWDGFHADHFRRARCPMNAAYYDANYLFKLQCVEVGSAEVRAHAANVKVLFCSLHGRAEFASAAHRKVRERAATPAQLKLLLAQIHADNAADALHWLPISDAHLARIESVFATAPATTFLRGADALHLASAAEHGFTEIHSNDRHLLAAAPLFGLRGVNVIPELSPASA